MSGITPILDTLLHQVLGRRVDIPLPKDLNAEVPAVLPVQGARPLHSDSRLDPREQPSTTRAAAPLGGQAGQAVASRPGVAPEAAARPLPQASAATSFSAAARVIADLLRQLPNPPSAIAPGAPLLAAAPEGPEAVGQIAARLQQSIQSSGLFYEAHVARWSRGEFPLDALRLEPQMRASALSAPAPAPAPAPASGVAAGAGSESAVESAPSAAETVRAVREPRGVVEESAPEARQPVLPGEGAPLLRQQLEMLAQPQVRWEGNVWAGVFVALSIQPPWSEPPVDAGADDGARERGAGQGEWRVRLGMRLDGHGELEVAISLHGERLALTLQSESAGVRGYFQATRGALEERLLACGFRQVQLRLVEAGQEVDDGR